MLKSITLTNFFSFHEPTTINFNSQINMFLGINSSGKSNLFKAFQLLQAALAGEGLEKLIQEEWLGMDNIVNKKVKEENKKFTIICVLENNYDTLSYTIEFIKKDYEYYLEEKLLIYKTNPSNNSHELLGGFENTFGKSYYYVTNEEGKIEHVNFEIKKKKESFLNISPVNKKEIFLNTVIYNYFNTSFQSPIRQAAAPNSSKYLSQTGENLVHILNYLQHNQAQAYEMLLERMLEINPHFKDIAFLVYGARIAFALRKKGLNSTILAEHISNGTLQYMLLLSIFCNPDSPEIICIDEPETGLHPDMIQAIAELIKYAARTYNKQIFVVTHSPLLLNAFELEDAFFFEKDKDNNTIVRQHQEEDFEEDIQHLTLGQLWLTGKLGGTRY